MKAGNVAQILVEWKSAATASWDTGNFGVLPDGKFTYRNLGGSQNGEGFITSASYITA